MRCPVIYIPVKNKGSSKVYDSFFVRIPIELVKLFGVIKGELFKPDVEFDTATGEQILVLRYRKPTVKVIVPDSIITDKNVEVKELIKIGEGVIKEDLPLLKELAKEEVKEGENENK